MQHLSWPVATMPRTCLKLELLHLSFCNFKTCSQLTGTVLDNVIFLPSRAAMENRGYPDLFHYSSATLERDCCKQHVLDKDERSMMNWKSSQLHGCSRKQHAINSPVDTLHCPMSKFTLFQTGKYLHQVKISANTLNTGNNTAIVLITHGDMALIF